MTAPDADPRLSLAVQTMKTLFRADYSVDPREGEPENARDLNRLMVEHAFADSWARPRMEPRTKSLITISMMVALGQSDELRAHVKGALVLGISKEEIVEVLIHTLAYCGAPRTAAAWAIVRKVFAAPPPATPPSTPPSASPSASPPARDG